jgi:hypothetical protein
MSHKRRNYFFALVDRFVIQPLQQLWSFLWSNLSSFWNQSQHTDSESNQMSSNNGTDLRIFEQSDSDVVPLSFSKVSRLSMGSQGSLSGDYSESIELTNHWMFKRGLTADTFYCEIRMPCSYGEKTPSSYFPTEFQNNPNFTFHREKSAYWGGDCYKYRMTTSRQEVSLQQLEPFSKFKHLSFPTKIPLLHNSVITDNPREGSTTSIKRINI